MSGGIDDVTDMPYFRFYAEVYEIHCIICLKKNKIVEGGEDCIHFKKYYFELIYDPEADFEEIGHGW